jgi:diguanylate cyclase (GGDEF)-like protein
VGHAIRGRSAQRVDNWATDGELLRYLGVVEVAAAPVIVSEQPQGIICGDTFFRNVDVSDSDVALLGILATDLSLAIENHILARQATKLQALASKDELTGVHNRRSLMNLLQREVDRAHRYGSPLSAVMVDLDSFKSFNDNYGHMVGDEVLREVAQVIVANSREIDVIGRYGGDEFLVVLPETDQHQATVYAERIRAAIEGLGRETRKHYPLCSLSLSIGVTSVANPDDTLEKLVHRADHALLAAKQRGRNRVCLD